jgi:hypothetical protein
MRRAKPHDIAVNATGGIPLKALRRILIAWSF